jgi:phosphoribosylformylglycinamidine synthase
VGAGAIGAILEAPPPGSPAHAFWFGEDQARYVVAARSEHVDAIIRRAEAAGVAIALLGVTGGDVLALEGERPLPVKALRENFERWFPSYMAGP